MKISVVSPMYNEVEVIPHFLLSITSVLKDTGEDYEIICINDGSTDETLLALKQNKETYPQLRIINFSRNFGKESALTAGIEHVSGDVVIPIDADLQDPPELIHEMIKKYKSGYDVVLARRADRTVDSWAKRTTAEWFYKVMGKISKIDMHANVGDFRLMSKRVVDTITSLEETQRYMKGMFSWPGYSTTIIDYQRTERVAGNTSFNFLSLWNLAVEGITSFSIAPLKLSILLGLIVSVCSFVYASVTIIKTIFFGIDVPGYASITVLILLLNGVQFILLGILGEYVGRVYMETKRRPVYVIEGIY